MGLAAPRATLVLAVKLACCCRRAMSDGFCFELRSTGRGAMSNDPGLSDNEYHVSCGVRRKFHTSERLRESKSSRHVKLPWCGIGDGGCGGSAGRFSTRGTAASPSKMIGQSSSQLTGSRNVSRPMFVLLFSYGRQPRNTAHHSSAGVRTKSACPTQVIGFGRDGGRWRCVRIGLPRVSYGPHTSRLRNTTCECSGPVPPSAAVR